MMRHQQKFYFFARLCLCFPNKLQSKSLSTSINVCIRAGKELEAGKFFDRANENNLDQIRFNKNHSHITLCESVLPRIQQCMQFKCRSEMAHWMFLSQPFM